MSRGLGSIERKIRDVLKHREISVIEIARILNYLYSPNHTEYNSVLRAVNSLKDKGIVETKTFPNYRNLKSKIKGSRIRMVRLLGRSRSSRSWRYDEKVKEVEKMEKKRKMPKATSYEYFELERYM
jgi:hypothetical protein